MHDRSLKRAQRGARTVALLTALCTVALLGACSGDSPQALVASGKKLVERKDPRGAALQFKNALQLSSDLKGVRLLLGNALLEAGEPGAAIVELTKALQEGEARDAVLPPLARAMVDGAEYRKLVMQYDNQGLNDTQAQASLKTSLAMAWGALNDNKRMDAALAEALKAVPDYGPAQVLRARGLASRGELDAALVIVDKELQRVPVDPDAWYLKGEILGFIRNDSKAGVEAMKQALSINRAHVPSHNGLVGLALRNKDMAAARAQIEQLRAVLPNHPALVFMEAQLALYDSKTDIARDKVLSLLKNSPEHVGLLQLAGMIEGQAGALVVAESYLTKALQIDPKLPLARRSLGLTYLKMGRYPRVVEVLKPMTGPDHADAGALAMAGEALLRMGDAKGSEALFTRSAKLNPNDTGVNTALAMSHLGRGDIARTFGELDTLSRATPDDIVADMALISAHMRRSEWDAALKALDEAAKKSPGNVTLLELRGRVHLARNDFAAARESLVKALTIDPKYFAAIGSLTAIDLLERKPEQATKRLRDAFKADPRNYLAAMALADLRARYGAPLDEQRGILQEAIKGSPAEAVPRLALIELNVRNKRNNDALQVAQDASSALPNNALVLNALASVQTQNGDVQQAISTYRRLSNIEPKDVSPLLSLADLYRNAGDRSNAEATWRRVLDIEPANPTAPTRLVESIIASRKPAEALAEAATMQQRQADNPIGYLLEAVVHQRAKAPDKAVEALRNGLKRTPANTDLALRMHQSLMASGRAADADKLAVSWPKEHPEDTTFELELANGHTARGELAPAERILRSLVARHPQAPLALNNLAWLLAVQRKPGGVDLAQRAIANGRESAAMLDTLALALAAEGQPARALDTQRRAVAAAPNDVSMRLTLARLAAEAGDKALARSEIEALTARNLPPPLQAEANRILKSL